MVLQAAVLNPTEQYSELTKFLKKLVAEEVRNGNFHNLSPARTSKRMALGPVCNYKAYVHPIARPPDLPSTGERNLELGRLEISVVIKAPLRNSGKYGAGLDMPSGLENGCMRLCLGPNIGAFDDLSARIVERWRAAKPGLAEALSAADYSSFASQLLPAIERSFAEFKLAAPLYVLEERLK